MADAVDKVAVKQRIGNNRIQVPRSLNQYCATDFCSDSMLLAHGSKIFYRQHRHLADIDIAALA